MSNDLTKTKPRLFYSFIKSKIDKKLIVSKPKPFSIPLAILASIFNYCLSNAFTTLAKS